MKTIRFKYLMILLVCCTTAAFAQIKKLEKTYKTNADVSLNIDARHTNVVVEHWDRNEVQIEAFLEADQVDKEKTKQLLESWKLETTGNAGRVTITSGGGGGMTMPNMDMAALNEPLAKLPEIVDPVMEMVGPLLESISKNPLPPEFFEKMGDLNFDHEAYRKEGDAYMKRWEKKVEKNFGKDFERTMEEWAANFEKDTVLWKKDMEMKMERWGEEFGKSMEVWGEQFGKEMEQWASQFEKEMEAQESKMEQHFVISESAKAKRTIHVKMPKNGQMELNIRHGEVKLGGRSTNLKAELSHSRLSANTISGNQTSVKASYTPVKVNRWDYGVLQTTYVKNCDIETARSVKISSNSSDVRIGEILETGIISGTFGKLRINKLAPGFSTLDITLENSDLTLDLPDAALDFSYNGSQSKIQHPTSIKGNPVKSYDSEIINGYHKSKNGNGTVSIKAKFSDVVLK